MNRRDFVKMAGLGVASAALGGCSSVFERLGAKRTDRPNIIFIMADDHDTGAISAYGRGINRTPNIDRLADEGMLFRNCFCTNSICEPSRAVILTGKYSHINGVVDNSAWFDSGQDTFPKLLQQAGYQTAVVGKWHLRSEPAGFDYWNIFPGQGDYYNPLMIEVGERKRHEGYATDIVTDFSLEWLRKRDKNKPFCLLCHHKATHGWWEPGPEHLDMYDDVEIPEPDTLFDDYSTRSAAAREQQMSIETGIHNPEHAFKFTAPKNLNAEQLAKWNAAYEAKNEAFKEADLKGRELVRWKYQRYMKDYLRCVASIDDNVGKMLDYLDQAGLSENTIVVYTSDQGFYLGDHGWYDKRFMYEQSLRMPLLIRYPREVEANSVSFDMVMNLDFCPTFLDFAGVDIPGGVQGESFKKILGGKAPKNWRKSIYYHFYEYPWVHMVKRHYGVRTKRFKLIHFYYDIDAWELYDLQKDPREINNVYGNPAYAGIVRELKAELARLREKYGDSDELTQKFLEAHLNREDMPERYRLKR